MPGRVMVDDDEQMIADLLREHRRHRGQVASQMPMPAKDAFTVAGTPLTTYTLTAIPLKSDLGSSLVLSLNGLVVVEGTDYTVDYSTAVVTLAATPTAADVLYAEYWTTGELVAGTLIPETDTRTDNFNRADSATTLNPASDGGTWTAFTFDILTPVMGIKSNQAYSVSNDGTNRFHYTDLGAVGSDMSITDSWTSFGRGQFYVAVDPTAGTGYRLNGFTGDLNRFVAVPGSNAFTDTLIGTFASVVGNGNIVRLTYDPAAGHIDLYLAGTHIGTLTDGTPLTGGGNTCVGFGSSQTYYVGGGSSGTVNTGETFDNFTAIPL